MATNLFVRKYSNQYDKDEQGSEPILSVWIRSRLGGMSDYGGGGVELVYNRNGEIQRYGGLIGKLYINCQWNTDEKDCHPYGYNVGMRFDSTYNNPEDLVQAATLLKTIKARMDKLTELWGEPRSFEEFAIMFANALGIRYVTYQKNLRVGWDENMGTRNLGSLKWDWDFALRALKQTVAAPVPEG